MSSRVPGLVDVTPDVFAHDRTCYRWANANIEFFSPVERLSHVCMAEHKQQQRKRNASNYMHTLNMAGRVSMRWNHGNHYGNFRPGTFGIRGVEVHAENAHAIAILLNTQH